ncbi:MAG TPA: hypothetical protein VE262_21740 [Blastocatellia bacterium]|nr:hypothetical protein [Blastocatellia bacterium]
MKAMTAFIALALCVALPAQSAMSQSLEMRPRRISAAAAPEPAPVYPESGSGLAAPTTLDSMIARDDLSFYVEVRNGGLGELARSAGALAPFAKMIAPGKKGIASVDLSGFVMAHFARLSSSRLAVAGYGGGGAALLIEAMNSTEADKLGADISRLLLAGSAEMDVSVQGAIVTAGTKGAVARITEAGGGSTLAEDQEFLKARSRFSADPFFAFIELGSVAGPWPAGVDGPENPAYVAGALAAINGMPYAVAMGGSLRGETASLRALMLFGRKQKKGIFSSLLTSTRMGMSSAESFATSDSDIFLDAMLDWEKIYEMMQSFFLTLGSAAMPPSPHADGAQALKSADPLAMIEASLGLSIRDDLLPTLGNEVAVSLSNLDGLIAPAPKGARARSKAQPFRFMFMLALKDPGRFEKLITKLINPPGGAARPLAQAYHRGARINYRNDIAYTVSSGFLIAGGSLNDIRRALDARALGTSLGSSPEFRSAMGEPRPSMMQVFVSSRVSGKLQEVLQTEAAKLYPGLAEASAPARAPLAVSMKHDEDGIMLEMRVPVSFAFMALNSMTKSNPASLSGGSVTGPARGRGRSRTPRLTDEDLRLRRP